MVSSLTITDHAGNVRCQLRSVDKRIVVSIVASWLECHGDETEADVSLRSPSGPWPEEEK